MYSQNITISRLSILQIYTTKTAQQCTTPTILIKFGEFIVHSKPNNMTLSDFPGKISETRKIVFNFLSVA